MLKRLFYIRTVIMSIASGPVVLINLLRISAVSLPFAFLPRLYYLNFI